MAMSRLKGTVEKEGYVRNIITSLVMLLALSGLLILGWFAYEEERNPPDLTQIPLVKANPNPYKIKPNDPGGMDIPNTDKVVYNTIAQENSDRLFNKTLEKMLPPPEEPVKREEIVNSTLKKIPSPEKINIVEVKLPEKEIYDVVTSDDIKVTMLDSKKGDHEIVKLSKIPMKPFGKNTKITKKKPIKISLARMPKAAKKSIRAKKIAKNLPAKLTDKVKGYRVQLGSYKSINGLEKGWKILQRKFPKQLSKLRYSIKKVELGSKGIYYRLHVGPLSKRDDASKICKELSAKKQGCLIAR